MFMEKLKRLKNGKYITCGVLIVDNENSILAGHPTGRKYDKECYDILKGCCDEGEEDIDCAIREVREESGIVLSKDDSLIDLGIISYRSDKDIHLFLHRVDTLPDVKSLKCTSYFYTHDGKFLPEMNGFRVIKKDERQLLHKGLQKVIKGIKEIQ